MYNTMRAPGFRSVPVQPRDTIHGYVISAIFFAVVLFGMWLVYKMFMSSKWNSSNTAAKSQDPLDIAKARFAKGEITKEQLADIRKELKA